MTDCDKDVEKALASLEDLSARELEVTGEKLARRRDGLRAFGPVFADVARKRRGGPADNARFQLKTAIARVDERLAEQSKVLRHPSGRMCVTPWPSGRPARAASVTPRPSASQASWRDADTSRGPGQALLSRVRICRRAACR